MFCAWEQAEYGARWTAYEWRSERAEPAVRACLLDIPASFPSCIVAWPNGFPSPPTMLTSARRMFRALQPAPRAANAACSAVESSVSEVQVRPTILRFSTIRHNREFVRHDSSPHRRLRGFRLRVGGSWREFVGVAVARAETRDTSARRRTAIVKSHRGWPAAQFYFLRAAASACECSASPRSARLDDERETHESGYGVCIR